MEWEIPATRSGRARGLAGRPAGPPGARAGRRRAASKRAAGLLVLAIWSGDPTAGATTEPPVPIDVVCWRDGLLSVHADGTPLPDLLQELVQESGATVRGPLANPGPVSVQFDALPLELALERLLGGQGFAVVYGPGGQVRSIRLLGQHPGDPLDLAPTARPAEAPIELADTDDGGVKEASVRPVPITGRLARVLGRDTASFQDLLTVAMRHDDPRTRVQAMRAGLHVLGREPALRESIEQSLEAAGPERVAGWLERLAGPHARHVARAARRGLRGSTVQRTAAAVADHLADRARRP